MLDKWIQEQQSQAPEVADPEPLEIPRPPFARSGLYGSTSSNPYLAYPDLQHTFSDRGARTDEASSIISYDLVDDDDIPSNTIPETETTLASSEVCSVPHSSCSCLMRFP